VRRRRAACLLVLGACAAAVAALAAANAAPPQRRGFLPWLATRKLQSASIWAVGDAADGSANAQTLANRIVRARPTIFLYLGDVYPDGAFSDFQSHYAPLYGSLVRVTAPTPGNHETPNYAAGYVRYWHDVLHGPVPAFYSFRVAGWQILSLDSELRHDPASPQVRWLRGQVGGPGTCRIAFWHRPRYSAGTRHGDQPDVAPFWNVLAHHAVLVVNGHEHDLQRQAPRDGITELVAGAGGSELYTLRSGYQGLMFGDDHDQGALHLKLTAGTARYSFVLADGRVVDSGATRCRR
jgi:hypothetical protein